MELSSQISELQATYEALSVILSSVCQRLAEITQYHDMLGTDTYNKLLQWQADMNNQLMQIRAEIENYYIKMDQVRKALMGSVSENKVEEVEQVNNEEQEDAARSKNPDDFLVVEDREKVTTFHLQVKKNGEYDRGLCAAAWAALFSPGGHRGQKYQGPKINEAKKKLRAIYKKQGWEMPSEK